MKRRTLRRELRIVTKEEMMAALDRAKKSLERASNLAVDCTDITADSATWKNLSKSIDLVFGCWLDLKYGEETPAK